MKSDLEILKEYENRIVDLSRRNRLLKYPKNARSIDFEMNLEEFQNRFGSPDELTIPFPHREILNPKDEEEEIPEVEKVYIPPTRPNGEKLINLLNSFRLDTKRKFEEHGLYTLFLAIGKVRWSEKLAGKGSSDAIEEFDYNAPILLIPVQIEEKKVPKKTIITTNGEYDITSNKVLSLLLKMEYDARPIELKERGDNTPLNLRDMMSDLVGQMKEIFETQKIKYEISEEIQLGQYSFYGQQIYEDLNKNEKKVLATEFIEALCTHTPIQQENLEISLDDPDALLNPDNDFNVLDADVSQLKVIQNALGGNHLNIQGPPGTGKSQTIVNLIANLLARGKKVLLVCEKQVALEVVLDRLKSVGLDKLCLPLFHYNADKKLFAKKIIEDRDNVAKWATRVNTLDSVLANRQKKIQRLREYATALGTIPENLGKSVYWIHGELAKYQDIASGEQSLPWKGKDPLSISFDDYQNLITLFDNISPVYNVTSDEAYSHWHNLKRQHFTPDFASRLGQSLEGTRRLVEGFQANPTQYFLPQSVASIRHLLALSELVESVKFLDIAVNSEANFPEIISILDKAIEKSQEYRKLNADFGKSYAIPAHSHIDEIPAFENLKDETVISTIRDANTDYVNLDHHLDIILECLGKLPSKDYLSMASIKEILHAKKLFLIDPFINLLKEWDQYVRLQSISEQLKNLDILFTKLNEAKNTFDKWALISSDLHRESTLQIAERFEKDYRFFWRVFRSQYKKDCQQIASWCNLNAPKKYSEFLTVISAARDWFLSKDRFEVLFSHFVQEHIHQEVPFDPNLIQLLRNQVNILLEWLAPGKNEIPEAIISFLKTNRDRQAVVNLFDSLEALDRVNDAHSSIFNFPADSYSSVRAFANVLPSLRNNLTYCLQAYNETINFISENEHPKNVIHLKNDIAALKILSKGVRALSELSLDHYFAGEDIASEFINHKDKYVQLAENFKVIFSIANSLLPDIRDLSLERALRIVDELKIDLPTLQEWFAKYEKQLAELGELFGNNLTIQSFEELKFNDFKKKIEFMISDESGLERSMLYQRYAAQIEILGQGWFLQETKSKTINNPTALFAVSFWNAWLGQYYEKHAILKNFTIKEHTKLIKEFQKLEGEVLEVNAQRVLHAVSPNVKYAKQQGGAKDYELVHQSQLKMRHKPIRHMVARCDEQLIKYKPCWMMSPLTLSSYIPYGSVVFDVVIFDEASQMRVEHSLGAIARAKQVLIFGDENQLPPTSFFEISNDGEEDNNDENYESILNATKEILPGADQMLTYHYRSKYEDLIAFSNKYIYDYRLITFPNPDHHKSVIFEYVKNGVFDVGGKRRNEEEAKKVANICIQRAIEEPTKSLGVIAFSRTQEVAIRDALAEALKDKPQLQNKLDETSDQADPFFIKNLESVQGDERDIIVLSVGYGPDKEGNIYNRFGPLNSQNGYRRLNVAVTRAKEKIICVSSLRATDIHPSENNRGGFLLQKYLEFAEKGIKSLEASQLLQNNEGVEADSPFELEVQSALENKGYTIHRQVGASGFKIDLAIVNPQNHQGYTLGIECDGASYHSSYSARMNDRIRQEILQRLGWKLYRIWSQHWLTHKNEIIEDIVRMVESETAKTELARAK